MDKVFSKTEQKLIIFSIDFTPLALKQVLIFSNLSTMYIYSNLIHWRF